MRKLSSTYSLITASEMDPILACYEHVGPYYQGATQKDFHLQKIPAVLERTGEILQVMVASLHTH